MPAVGKQLLVIGNGGREHAICWKLSQSAQVTKIYALPGNPGIALEKKCENVLGVNAKDFNAISKWCLDKKIDMVIVGPEDPLAEGLADILQRAGIRCFGPGQNGAQIEADKKWAKDFMLRHKIPTARYETFTNTQKAKEFIKSAPYRALVVKASGLAAGKGVVVAANTNEACQAVEQILGDKKFGCAGETVVVEELLTGEEVSVLAFVDKNTVRIMLPAQDHKRLKDNDLGPNTGGMGAYCPCPLISAEALELVRTQVLEKALIGLRSEGISYCGVLYAGMMLTPDGPKTLEFNCRFGDPETQVILPLLETDLFDVMFACCNNTLKEIDLKWRNGVSAVGVVMASAGYPETSTKGCIIEGGGAQFRSDIAQKAFKTFFLPLFSQTTSLSYKDSGVDIDAGDALVQRIKVLSAGTTKRPGVLGGLGGFGGLFRLKELKYKNPVICEAVNGVGAKIQLSLAHDMYEALGYDLFAMCANEVLESGAEPVAFLDYIACGKLEVPVAAQIVKGISDGCRAANCALVGGETAEMPSVYEIGKYDIAGYCVGIIEKGNELPKFDLYEEGDLLVALPSSGLHCAGFNAILNYIKKFDIDLNKKSEFGDRNKTLAQQLAETSYIYVSNVLQLIHSKAIKAVAHITSGLLIDVSRIIPTNFEVCLDFNSLEIPEIFPWLAAKLKLKPDTLLENLNCGVGMVMVVSKTNTNWREQLRDAVCLGTLKSRSSSPQVRVRNFAETLEKLTAKYGAIGSNELKETHHRALQATLTQKSEARSETYKTQSGKRLTEVPKTFTDPIMIMGTDGVGTKIKIAQQTKRNCSVGIDLVAMCVNDILCNGAEPYTFSSYYACGEVEEHMSSKIMDGVVEGSRQAGSSLIETHISEVPLLYKHDVYDLAGFSLGIAENSRTLPKTADIQPGDVLIGLPSSGVHSNGFSLVHAVMKVAGVGFSDKAPYSNATFGEEFLKPTKIYVKALAPILRQGLIKAMAHITGGGLTENIPRVLRKDLAVHLNADNFTIPPVFAWLGMKGNITSAEMQRTYNCGLGMVLVVDPKYECQVMEQLQYSERASKIGYVTRRETANSPQVVVENFTQNLTRIQKVINTPRKRVAVLISGSGTNLQALINASRDTSQCLHSDIVLVISNKADVMGLERAKTAGIPTVVISHKDFTSRDEFDAEMTKHLQKAKADFVCLAGFMRLLSEPFVKQWKGKLLNIHPSLLPKHPGMHVQKKAIDAGDKESGCTVHFVDEGVDTGPVVVQSSVPILPGDTEEFLTQRIHKAEHYAYPRALHLVVTGRVSLGKDGNILRV
uniref:Trifunctional purine biosynthetic protein adenosine-3 n=2 Tax=Glossina morsitans morsitans TaxID=37546 RepID=A0A1B0FHK5_GLOMM